MNPLTSLLKSGYKVDSGILVKKLERTQPTLIRISTESWRNIWERRLRREVLENRVMDWRELPALKLESTQQDYLRIMGY